MRLSHGILSVCAICALATSPALAQSTSGPATGSGSQAPARREPAMAPSTSSDRGQTGSGAVPHGHSKGTDGSSGSTSSDQTGSGSTSQSQMGSASQSTRGTAQGGMNSDQVRRAQEALRAQGHDPGPIDGVMGARTQQALRDFQTSQQLNSTGQLDRETMEKLGIGRTSSRQ